MEAVEVQGKMLRPFVEALRAGGPLGHLNLTLVPLRSQRHDELDYILAADAIAAGTLTVAEVSEGGSVPELLATNSGATMVLLLDGEELIGAKQNRILNTSVLLPPGSKTKIPVSCVEQGRWRHVSTEFSSGSYSPARLRARKSRDVSRNLAASGEARSDQGAVWAEVAASVQSSGSHAPTMAMHDVVDQLHDHVEGYVAALAYPTGACGVVAAIDGKFVALDVFDRPQTLERIWPRLVSGYVLDALTAPKPAHAGKSMSASAASALVEHLGEIPCRAQPTVGVGEDWRFEAEDVLGQALVAGDQFLHLCAFPNVRPDGGRGDGPSLLPPSARRRLRRREEHD